MWAHIEMSLCRSGFTQPQNDPPRGQLHGIRHHLRYVMRLMLHPHSTGFNPLPCLNFLALSLINVSGGRLSYGTHVYGITVIGYRIVGSTAPPATEI